MLASLLVLFLEGARARSSAAERHRRAQQLEAREPALYRQLAERDAVLESQRRIYMERFRRLEAQIRLNDAEIATLRRRLTIGTTGPGGSD
jgi:hypothetical protein